ncbi:hypothetical protein [Mesorhizobium sp. SARCC-RB16n]|uniref:hypothetical protein n=1 Tax=Mesorhizobium sp. SARCC-RB16n TaxID=2116687 RepID=UPI00122F0412|nr:hypothetical protein [Mesorhizobium sp. SARCC-RB16n]
MDTPKRPRGGPRQPDAPTPAERQRACRARLAAAGRAPRVQRIIDDRFDSKTQVIVERAFFEEQRRNLHNALLKIELLDEARARIDRRNSSLEGELKRLEQLHTISLKEIVLLKQSLAIKK